MFQQRRIDSLVKKKRRRKGNLDWLSFYSPILLPPSFNSLFVLPACLCTSVSVVLTIYVMSCYRVCNFFVPIE